MCRRKTLLPVPEGPSTQTTSPWEIWKLTQASTSRLAYLFHTSRNSTMVSPRTRPARVRPSVWTVLLIEKGSQRQEELGQEEVGDEHANRGEDDRARRGHADRGRAPLHTQAVGAAD